MPYHVLLVDDDHYFRTEFKEFMLDFDVIEAPNGKEALKILQRPHSIDLIILDEQLPDTRGTDLLKKVHSISPKTHTIILTGHSSKEVAIDAVKGQATYYIEKPLTTKKIEEIRHLLLSAPQGEKDRSTSGIKGNIEQAKYFAERNYDKKLTLNDVAKEVHLSPKYLSRIFKEKTGMSFMEYKLQLRMEKAKGLLKESGDTIEEISYKLGYQNPESFGKIFKKMTRLSPREYREQKNKKISARKLKKDHVHRKEYREVLIANKVLSEAKGAIVEYDLKGQIIGWSKSAERFYGWKEKEMLGTACKNTSLRKKIKSLAKISHEEVSVQEGFEIKQRTKSGKVLDTWCKIFPVRDSKKRVEYCITFERDISERKKKQLKGVITELDEIKKEKATAVKIIEEKERALYRTRLHLERERYFAGLGRLAAIVAHEMRRPISSIQMAAWIIKRKNQNPALNGNIACIENMVEESDQIISNLLNYSRIKKPIYKQVFIVPLLNRCLDSIQKLFSSKKAELKKDLRQLTRKRFYTDPVQFKEIVSNIIMNAYEAFPDKKKGTITLTAETTKNELILKISDTGSGIAKDDLEKVYEPFFSRKHKGTGLGLSVCREIIALHEGRIDIDSKINKGTTVIIQLPLKKKNT